MVENSLTYAGNALFDCGGGQTFTKHESVISDGGTANGGSGQAAAITEDPFSQTRHAAWNVDGGQASAIIEGILADACHAGWDGDRCQTTATTEGDIADACNGKVRVTTIVI